MAEFESLNYKTDKLFRFHALEAVMATFRPASHIQRAVEAYNEPVVYMLLPMLFKGKIKLRNIASVFFRAPDYIELSALLR